MTARTSSVIKSESVLYQQPIAPLPPSRAEILSSRTATIARRYPALFQIVLGSSLVTVFKNVGGGLANGLPGHR